MTAAPEAAARAVTVAADADWTRWSSDDPARLLDSAADWLWESDAEHRFTWFSEGFKRTTGLDPSRAVGQSWLDVFVAVARDGGDVAACHDALARHAPLRDIVYRPRGALPSCTWVAATGIPLFDGDGRFAGYRGIGRNVTAQMNALARLSDGQANRPDLGETNAERMMAALNLMDDGFCYFDADDRLVLYNEAYPALHPGIADLIRVGVSFPELLDAALARGRFDTGGLTDAQFREAVLSARRSEHQSQMIMTMADGRSIMRRTMRTDDGGLISISTDVTSIRQREEALAGASAQATELLSDMQRTIDAMDMGVVVLGPDMRAELINRAFYDIWRVTPDDVAVGSPFRALMDINRHNGIYAVDDPDWERYVDGRLAEIAGGDVPPREFRRADGCTMIYAVTSLSGGKRLITYFDVTDLRRRETEAREAREQLERVIGSLPAGVIIYDKDNRFVLSNDLIKETLPALAHEMRPGRPLRASLEAAHAAGYFRNSGDAALDALYDTDREAWLQGYERRYDARRAVSERRNPDGRWFQVFDSRTSDGTYVGVRVDITELKEREAALLQTTRENELFRNLVDNVPVAIYAKQEDLRLIYVNRGWTDLTGIAAEAAIGRTDAEVFGPQGEAFMEGDRQVLASTETLEIEESAVGPDGVLRHQIARKSVMTASDGSRYLIGSTSDVTELKQRECELEDARQRAVLADRAKSEFLANMSHEIRTPMNGVLGMAELLAKSELDPKQRTFTDIIVKSGNALLTIINDILDFSKIDAGQLVLDPAPFNLGEAIEDVATLVSARAKEKDLELIVRVQPGLPDIFVGDVGRIRQIVTNIVGNAVKFTDHGHVLIDVTGEIAGAATRLSIAVTDTGIGIPADKLATIFDKFSQVDASSTRRHEGTGLGLAITSRLVELMNGRIDVTSSEGAGSTFTIVIELEAAAEQKRRRHMPLDVTGARILVVDDNPVNRAILMEQMRSWGFDACAAENGVEGIKVLEVAAAHGLSVDCVVLDYQMPGMTGADMARIVRSRPTLTGTPIIMLTSVDQTLSNKSYRDLAIDAHLIKPARSSALLDALVTTIQRHRATLAEIAGTAGTEHRHAEQAAAPQPQAPQRQVPAPRLRPPSSEHLVDILVAEDNEVNQLVFTQILGETPWTFEIVGNGRLAVEAFDTMNPRMILMDVSMPQMNGLEATAAIRSRQDRLGRHTPIVGVTAHALKGDRERCLEAGMDDYLSKPISPNALLAKVERWIGEESAGQLAG